jgi:hypothetical protein
VTGAKYDHSKKVHIARVESEGVINEVEVTDDWAGFVSERFKWKPETLPKPDKDGFTPIPVEEKIRTNDDRTIVRIKFVPKQTRYILDVNKMRSGSVSVEVTATGNRKSTKHQVKKKRITVDEHWIVRFWDGRSLNVSIDDPYVTENFSVKFLEELKRTRKGFVDIPVGDSKPSFLHQCPNLNVAGAPTIKYVQGSNEDLCISNSLASAFHNLGFVEEARQIAEFGRDNCLGGTVDALEKVTTFANKVLPNWIEMHRKKLDFDYKTQLTKKDVFVGVLKASDGNCSHAITIHEGWIYDANENVTIPLCSEGLDYCTSTEAQPSIFVEFKHGYIFRYMGKNKKHLKKMRLPTWQEKLN